MWPVEQTAYPLFPNEAGCNLLPELIVGKNEAHYRWRLFQRRLAVKFVFNTIFKEITN